MLGVSFFHIFPRNVAIHRYGYVKVSKGILSVFVIVG